MKYRELFDEYVQLLQEGTILRSQLLQIPKGYLVTKKISGKEYTYLQHTTMKKKKSDYIPAEALPRLRVLLAQREPLTARLEENQKEQARLESAVKILDAELSRTFFYLKQSADMDALPLSKRETALQFAGAMTALEGLSSHEETKAALHRWAKGQCRFTDIYMDTLQHYGITEVT